MPLPLVDKIERDLSNGTSWLVVLAAIARSSEPIHGYEIARQLSQESPEGLNFKQGTLYPMLRTMEAEGLINSTLVPSNEGPARKCFRLRQHGLFIPRRNNNGIFRRGWSHGWCVLSVMIANSG